MDAHVRVAGLFVLLEPFEVLARIGAKRNRPVQVVRFAALDQLLEVARKGQLLRGRALDEDVRPVLERGLLRLVLRLRPTDGDLAVPRLARSTALIELLDDLLLRRDVDQGVADLPGEGRSLWLHRRQRDVDRLLRQVEDAQVLDGVVLAAMRLVPALPELA